MSLTLEIVSHHGQPLGKHRSITFGQDGGTIGRSVEADWSLPDEKRFLSSRHASIDFRSGSYYIIDTSKNGVFINGADEPVGKGKPQRLFPGDKIRIGEFEISVTIENVDDTRETLLSTSHVDPVDARLRVESPDPTRADLVDAYAITGVGIEMYLEDDDAELLKPLYSKFGTGNTSAEQLAIAEPPPPKEPPRSEKPAAAPKPAAKAKAASKTAPAPKLAGASKQAEPAGTTLAAFFSAAGIKEPAMSDRESEEFLRKLGEITRELIGGMIDCLHVRALQKAQLKQSNTIIAPRENNRLKFAANFEEGFARLFLDDSDEYMNSVNSVRGAMSDIKQHQRDLLAATRQALNEYMTRLDPQQIEDRATNGRKSALLNAAGRLKYWDLYKDVYAVLANGPAGEFPQAWLDAFADAYGSEESDDASPESAAATAEAG